MNRQEIIEKLRYILISADDRNAEKYKTCTEDANIATDLGLSSVGLLYIVIAIEEEFGIRFDSVGASDFRVLGDVVDYIEEKLK